MAVHIFIIRDDTVIDNPRNILYNSHIIFLKGQKMDDADTRSIMIN